MNHDSIPRAYRAFRVDASGRIYRSHVLDCETDEQAITVARQFIDGHGVQLWDGSRKIANFPPVTAVEEAGGADPSNAAYASNGTMEEISRA
jgi:hypothetical protein